MLDCIPRPYFVRTEAPGRLVDVARSHLVDTAPGRLAGMAPVRFEYTVPGYLVGIELGQLAGTALGHPVGIAPGRLVDIAPGRLVDIAPGRLVDIAPGRPEDFVPARLVDMARSRTAGTDLFDMAEAQTVDSARNHFVSKDWAGMAEGHSVDMVVRGNRKAGIHCLRSNWSIAVVAGLRSHFAAGMVRWHMQAGTDTAHNQCLAGRRIRSFGCQGWKKTGLMDRDKNHSVASWRCIHRNSSAEVDAHCTIPLRRAMADLQSPSH